MDSKRKRDLSQTQMENRLRKLGWLPQGFMGYWKGPSGIAVSTWNYDRRRDAIRDMQRIDRQNAQRKAAKAVSQ